MWLPALSPVTFLRGPGSGLPDSPGGKALRKWPCCYTVSWQHFLDFGLWFCVGVHVTVCRSPLVMTSYESAGSWDICFILSCE